MRRYVLLEELHLVGEDPAVGEDQVLRLVRHIRRVQQLDARLLRQAIALLAVALAAGRHHVHPGVAPAARQRPDVVARQAEEAVLATAVGAHVAVAAEQLAVVERRHLVKALGRQCLALDGDDGMRRDARAQAGTARNPAVEGEGFLAHGPRDQVLRVIEAGLLPADPAVGHTVVIEREDEEAVHGRVLRSGSIVPKPDCALQYPEKQRAVRQTSQPVSIGSKNYLSPTASLKPWPAANAGTVLALILISLPLVGLRPALAFRLRGRKVPKPTTVTRFPLATLVTMVSNTAFTASPAALLLRLPARATT